MPTATTRPDGVAGDAGWVAVAAVAAAVVVTGFALWLAQRGEQRQVDLQLRDRIDRQREAAADNGLLFVERAMGDLPVLEPESPAWDQSLAVEVPLQRQNVTMPILEEATIDSVELRGLTDGSQVSWRLAWNDRTEDTNVDTGRFSDAVAIQLPIHGDANFTMGDAHQMVEILHWKGLWQKDLDEHFQDVQDLHPNYWADLYWFSQGPRPFRVPEAFSDPRSQTWFVAHQAGNPMAAFERPFPCEELVAEGFGTLTHQDRSVTAARGVWRDGRWTVVFSRPLRTDDPLDAQLWRGGTTNLGIAVWDGAAGNVGGRKHWSNWVTFEVSP